jgi:hypothetical protein
LPDVSISTCDDSEIDRFPQNLARVANVALRSIMPPRNTFRHPFSQSLSPRQLLQILQTMVQSVDGASCQAAPTGDIECCTASFLVSAVQNTWSRSARRQKIAQLAKISDNAVVTPSSTHDPALRCLISALRTEACHKSQGILNLEVSWVQGRDRALFESFWGHICRKVTEKC